MNSTKLAIGKIVGLHGIKGELKFMPYPGMDDFSWHTVTLKTGLLFKECTVQRVRTNKSIYLLTFDGYSSREESVELVGSELLINKADLPAAGPGEHYQFELIGLRAVGEDGTVIGTVIGIMPAGGNDLLRIESENGEVLIPAIEEFLLHIDLEKKKLVVRILDGLIPEANSK